MSHDGLSDSDIRDIFDKARIIALVGASNDLEKPSNYVGAYLQQHGYRVIPVNPGRAGTEINGEKVYAKLADIPEKFDFVDVFRRAEDVPGVVDEILALKDKPRVIWLQLGIVNDDAAAKAKSAGIIFAQDRCPRIEFPKLGIKGPK